MVKKTYKNILDEHGNITFNEDGSLAIETFERDYNEEELTKFNIQEKQDRINELKLFLGNTDIRVNRYHRQLALVNKGLLIETKLSESEYDTLELQREQWCDEINAIELELIELGVVE